MTCIELVMRTGDPLRVRAKCFGDFPCPTRPPGFRACDKKKLDDRDVLMGVTLLKEMERKSKWRGGFPTPPRPAAPYPPRGPPAVKAGAHLGRSRLASLAATLFPTLSNVHVDLL